MESFILSWIIRNPTKAIMGIIIIILLTLLAIQSIRLNYNKSELNRERGNNAFITSILDKQNSKIKQLNEDSKKALATIKRYKETAQEQREESNRRLNELLNNGKELKSCEEAIAWLSRQRP
jgi:Tfp pilus assembly protein PilN